MRTFKKVVSVFFFTLIFLLALIVGTLRFEVLNSSFVFSSFERNGVYEKLPSAFAKALPNDPNLSREEGAQFGQSMSAINPAAAKVVIEKNFSNVLDFLNGKAQDINISISPAELGIPEGATLSWSTNDASQERSGIFLIFYGIGNKLLIAFAVLLIILGFLYKLAGRAGLLTAGFLNPQTREPLQ